MKTHLQNPKVLAGAATLLFVLSLIGTGIFYNSSENLKDLLAGEKALTEKLTFEKQNLLRDIGRFKSDLADMRANNEKLDGLLSAANDKLAKKESEVAKLGKDNKSMKKQLDELKSIKDELNNEMAQLRLTIQMLKDENERLANTNAGLLAELQELKDKMQRFAPKANNFRVEVMRKKKDKLTVSAKKTHVVAVSFDYNMGAMASLGEQKVYLTVKDSNGNLVKSDAGGKTSVTVDGLQQNIEYSAVETVKGTPSNLTIRFEPDDDMKAGVYEAAVYSNTAYLGSARFRLVK